MKTSKFFALAICSGIAMSCVTAQDAENPPPPQITEETDTLEALQFAVVHGGEVLSQTKDLIQKRQACTASLTWLKEQIDQLILAESDRQLIHAAHLYMSCPDAESPRMYLKMVQSKRSLAQKLGWLIAASYPSMTMAEQVEAELGRLIEQDLMAKQYSAEMARAIQSNQLKGSYTILREGLFENGDPAFVEAMITLNPQRCSEDFMTYLSRADFEDLRQISIPKINMMSTSLIFSHFLSYPPSIAQPEISSLFLYAISRNRPLAEMATTVVVSYLPSQTRSMALILSTMDSAVQMALIEQVRRNLNSELRLFLEELKSMTAKKEVMEEISAIL
jgi:hypothetical protein